MPTCRPRRRCIAVLRLTLLASAQACASYRPPRVTPISPGSHVLVQAGRGATVQVLGVSDGRPGEAFCRASLAEGVVASAVGDTVTFRQLTRLHPVGEHDGRCVADRQPAMVVRSPGSQVTVARVDWGRTAVFVLVPVLIVAAVVAIALDNMTYE